MSRPLLITDCDEVLLHMVRHFGTWLGEAKDMDFAIPHGDFEQRITRRGEGPPLTRPEMWGLLDGFFPAEMHRQTLVPHAVQALATLAFLESHEPDLVACADALGVRPAALVAARERLDA